MSYSSSFVTHQRDQSVRRRHWRYEDQLRVGAVGVVVTVVGARVDRNHREVADDRLDVDLLLQMQHTIGQRSLWGHAMYSDAFTQRIQLHSLLVMIGNIFTSCHDWQYIIQICSHLAMIDISSGDRWLADISSGDRWLADISSGDRWLANTKSVHNSSCQEQTL